MKKMDSKKFHREMDKLMAAQNKGIKLTPRTKGERELVEMLKKCKSMKRCRWIFVHIIKNRSHLRTQIGQHRAWTFFIDSVWGTKYYEESFAAEFKKFNEARKKGTLCLSEF